MKFIKHTPEGAALTDAFINYRGYRGYILNWFTVIFFVQIGKTQRILALRLKKYHYQWFPRLLVTTSKWRTEE